MENVSVTDAAIIKDLEPLVNHFVIEWNMTVFEAWQIAIQLKTFREAVTLHKGV